MKALGHARRQRDARAVAAFGRRGLARQQHGHHRAQQVGHRGAGLLKPVEVSADRETLVADDGRARHQRLETGVQRIGVEQRQAGVEHVLAADLQVARGDQAPPPELRMRTAHALGQAGCAGGVQDGQHVARPQVGRFDAFGRRGGRHRAGAGSASPPAAHRRPAARSRAGPGRRHPPSPARRRRPHPPPAARRRCSPGCDAAACPRRGIDRHRHRAQPAAAQHHRQELDPVARHQRHAVAPAHAMGGQQRGPARRVRRRLAIFQCSARRLDPGARALARGLVHQHRRQCLRMHARVSPCWRRSATACRLLKIV